jgi:hypothetical protein
MRKLIWLLPLILVSGCNTKSLRTANYDLANAINKAAISTVQLGQQGVISASDENTILPIFYTMSQESDAITACIDNTNAGGNAAGCITPILTAINSQAAQASLGVKTTTAQATVSTLITGITAIFVEFENAGAQAPAGSN